MKYVVAIDGERRAVTIDGGGILIDGEPVSALLSAVGNTPLQLLTIGDTVHVVRVRRGSSRGAYTLWIDGYRYDVEALDERTRAIRDLDIERQVHAGPSPLTAPMPGLVVRVLVGEGDAVQAGQGLVVVEAMKMENELRAMVSARVKSVRVAPGVAVEKGALLVELESSDV